MKNLINFHVNGDSRGSLIALEENKNIPFNIKRVYYIFNTKPHVIRGKHAHKKIEQVLICLKGSVKIKLDNVIEKKDFYLDKPHIGLHIKELTWREMSEFSKDCVLMVLASELYNEDDYIRDYKEFLEEVAKKK